MNEKMPLPPAEGGQERELTPSELREQIERHLEGEGWGSEQVGGGLKGQIVERLMREGGTSTRLEDYTTEQIRSATEQPAIQDSIRMIEMSLDEAERVGVGNTEGLRERLRVITGAS